MTSAALLSLALILGQFAPQKSGSDPLAPELEVRVQKLGKELRCATCQGLSIADSPASMARSQLDKVRELVTAGKSDDEIREYFVARYGEWVLLDPPKTGWNMLVWAGPGVLLLLGGTVIAMQLRNKSRSQPSAAATESAAGKAGTPQTGAPAVEDEYLRAVRQELEQ